MAAEPPHAEPPQNQPEQIVWQGGRIIVGGPITPPTVDETRAGLAWASFWLLALTIGICLLLAAIHAVSMHDILSFLQPVLPTEAGLTGAAVAFYFRQQNGKPPAQSSN